eukprot:6182016-Pleurochrysis_carterae.AAC.1
MKSLELSFELCRYPPVTLRSGLSGEPSAAGRTGPIWVLEPQIGRNAEAEPSRIDAPTRGVVNI